LVKKHNMTRHIKNLVESVKYERINNK
jgi:hypothetical protein